MLPYSTLVCLRFLPALLRGAELELLVGVGTTSPGLLRSLHFTARD